MGRPINPIRKFLLRNKYTASQCKELCNLASTVVLRMTGNANFATPIPALATITTAEGLLRDAMALSNYKRNRGGKAATIDTQQKAISLRNLLLAELQYVENETRAAQGDDNNLYNAAVATAGFGVRSVRSIAPALQIPRFVRQMNSKKYPLSAHYIRWKKPLGLIKGYPVDGYNILEGDQILATTTRCSYTFPKGNIEKRTIKIQPFNSKGVGQSFLCNVQ